MYKLKFNLNIKWNNDVCYVFNLEYSAQHLNLKQEKTHKYIKHNVIYDCVKEWHEFDL